MSACSPRFLQRLSAEISNMQKIRKLLFPLLLVLAGCAQTPSDNLAWLDKTQKYSLPSFHCEKLTEKQQLLTFHADGKQLNLIVLTSCDKGRLTVLGLLPTGTRVFTLNKEGDKVTSETNLPFVSSVNPNQILSDMALSSFVVGDLTSVMPNGYRIRQEGNKRIIVNSEGDIVEEIVYLDGLKLMQINNPVFDYKISIKSLD